MKKGSELSVLEALLRLTDKDHFVTLGQISNYIRRNYGYDIERRTLYSDIEVLKMHGWEITGYTAEHPGYSIDQRRMSVKQAANAIVAYAKLDATAPGDVTALLKATAADFSKYQRDMLLTLLESFITLSPDDIAYLSGESA